MPQANTNSKPVPVRQPPPLVPTESAWTLVRLAVGLAGMGTSWLARKSGARVRPGAAPPLLPSEPGVAKERRAETDRQPPPGEHPLRYAAIGLAVELERLSSRASDGLGEALQPRPTPPSQPQKGGRIVSRGIIGREIDKMEARGRLELALMEKRGRSDLTRLIVEGQEQERAARAATEEALREAVGDVVEEVVQVSVTRVVESPAIREMVRVESSGLVEEVVDDIRARLVRADDLVELTVRRILHLRPPGGRLGPPGGRGTPSSGPVAGTGLSDKTGAPRP